MNLRELVRNYYIDFNISLSNVDDIIALLERANISHIECLPDWTSGLWAYRFGAPHRDENSVVIGNLNVYHRVDLLINVLMNVKRWLNTKQINDYLKRLSNPEKHMDYLAEFSPLIHIHKLKRASYEEDDGGSNSRIDWTLEWSSSPCILLEVKNRINHDIVNYILKYDERQEKEMPPPITDCDALFKGIENKFQPVNMRQRLQGAWLNVALKKRSSIIEKYFFEELSPARIHFAIFNTYGESDCYIVVRNNRYRSLLIRRFGLEEYGNLIYA